MTTTPKNRHASKLTLVLLALLITGAYSCNSAADDKKADATVTDTAAKVSTDTSKMSTDTSKMKAADTTKMKAPDTTATKMAVDTSKMKAADTTKKKKKGPGRETKVPKP